MPYLTDFSPNPVRQQDHCQFENGLAKYGVAATTKEAGKAALEVFSKIGTLNTQ
jgi:hypothetical protein